MKTKIKITKTEVFESSPFTGFRINGKQLDELFDSCPLDEVCHSQDCSSKDKTDYQNCYHFSRFAGSPKVIAYIVERSLK